MPGDVLMALDTDMLFMVSEDRPPARPQAPAAQHVMNLHRTATTARQQDLPAVVVMSREVLPLVDLAPAVAARLDKSILDAILLRTGLASVLLVEPLRSRLRLRVNHNSSPVRG